MVARLVWRLFPFRRSWVRPPWTSKIFYTTKKGVPCGTLSFSMIHACMCQTKIGPCPPLANLAAKSAEMSHVHVILYSRMVSCHVAYTNYTVSICMFGKTYRMQYLSHTNYVWAHSSWVGIVRTRSTQWIHFRANTSTFVFEHYPLDHSSPLGIFRTSKILLSINLNMMIQFPQLSSLNPFIFSWFCAFDTNTKVFHIPSFWISYLSIKDCILMQFWKIF